MLIGAAVYNPNSFIAISVAKLGGLFCCCTQLALLMTLRVYKFDYHGQVFWDRRARLFNFELLQQLAALDPAAAAAGGSIATVPQYQNTILAQNGVPEALSG